ncbi:MAG: hypothetical protein ACXAB9_15955 [Candidatus Thorarchaeota archaeon]
MELWKYHKTSLKSRALKGSNGFLTGNEKTGTGYFIEPYYRLLICTRTMTPITTATPTITTAIISIGIGGGVTIPVGVVVGVVSVSLDNVKESIIVSSIVRTSILTCVEFTTTLQ